MSQDPRNVRDRIPEFATRQEEAEFWDTHDFADYWDEWDAVDVEFSDDLSSCVAIPLDTGSIIKVSALPGGEGRQPCVTHAFVDTRAAGRRCANSA